MNNGKRLQRFWDQRRAHPKGQLLGGYTVNPAKPFTKNRPINCRTIPWCFVFAVSLLYQYLMQGDCSPVTPYFLPFIVTLCVSVLFSTLKLPPPPQQNYITYVIATSSSEVDIFGWIRNFWSYSTFFDRGKSVFEICFSLHLATHILS